MLKAYVSSHHYRDQPGERDIFDVGFDPRPEKALYYPTWEEAESDCKLIFDRGNVQIDSSAGVKCILTNFRVEQRGPSEFVIFCEAPFADHKSQGASSRQEISNMN